MLLIGLTSLLIAIPLYSSTITPTLLTRITSIILLFSAALSFNSLHMQAIGSGLGLYSGLFHVTTVTQYMEIFIYVTGALILLGYASSNGTTHFKTSATPRIAEYSLIILFTTIGASFLISSADLVSMYLSIELQSFAVYILAAIYRNSESATSAGLKYFLLGALSSALILLGSSLIYAYTGSTNFESISMISFSAELKTSFPDFDSGSSPFQLVENISSQQFPSVAGKENGKETSYDENIVLGILVIGVGFLFKVAAAPFHNWAPDVYDGVPTIVTTWLTVMPKISIFIFLLIFESYFGSQVFHVNVNIWQNLLLTSSLLSLVIGTVVGLAQYRLKRLLAFSTISHVGFLLLALSVNSEESITSFLFYLIQYSMTNLNAFFVILAFGYLINLPLFKFSFPDSQRVGNMGNSWESNENLFSMKKGTSDISFISQLKGQFNANPILGLSFAVCLFSMAGIPPLVGFFAKYMVLYSAIENGYYFIALVGILASVISAAYYLRMIRVIHFDGLNDKESNSMLSTPFPFDSRSSQLSFQVSILESKFENGRETYNILTSAHSYVISVLTLFIVLFLLSPSLLLNSSNFLALSLFTA